MSKRIFVFINFPTGLKPYVDKVYKSTPYLETIFNRNEGSYVTKRDLERCGIMFPAGPRYLMLPHELPEHFEHYSPSGPDLFDIAHEEYMKEQKEKRDSKAKNRDPDME